MYIVIVASCAVLIAFAILLLSSILLFIRVFSTLRGTARHIIFVCVYNVAIYFPTAVAFRYYSVL